ncbi:RNAse P Rpr2/Rpp21/SNM1 subunit domain-containing protein [Schizothecium vesticola]|uniref:RNAse P Rpr2/Rpp21/SNM1 subunit domain-containing protein n=1 Tax=Schizothecium vesticola TaxID=314040 RepID=A0AA40F1K5_9PEZI|nr:RNAse P Rpr2/Rpp21/SNM1 subunit domain-containing protein [Schizothecium vesticola]
MAKGKNNGVQNRAIYSRASFLQQAATLLSLSAHREVSATSKGDSSPSQTRPVLQGMSRRLATDMRSVSLKTRIRLTPTVKQAVCKFCDSVLIEGHSCTSTVENRSRGGKKPWADVLVRRCHTCGRERRYPISAEKQRRKTERTEVSGASNDSIPQPVKKT